MNFRKAVTVLLVFLLLAGVHLFIYAKNVSLKYQLTDLKIQLAELNSRNRDLSVKLARAENLPVIEKAAREKLGMAYPVKMNYLITSGETVPAKK